MIATSALPPVPSGQSFTVPDVNYGFTFSIYSQAALPAPVQSPPPARASVPLSLAIEQVIAAKTNAGLRPNSIKQLRCILGQFAKGRESVPLASVVVRDIEIWLATRKGKPMTLQSNIGRLSSLFSYHIRRDNITDNPCKRLEKIKIEHTAPVILKPSQADKLLRVTPRRFRPYVILGMFAGIRPEELLKMTWDDVCLDTNTARVNHAKTRRRRIVPLEPCAVALLAACREKTGPIAPPFNAVRRFKKHTHASLGFTQWPQDLLRHTAASYLLALHQDAGKVASRLGNSSSVLLTHYHQPVTKADCEKFWSLSVMPPLPPPAPTLYNRKYNRVVVKAFYRKCKSYKQTQAHFKISSAGTLHYLLRDRRQMISSK